MINNIFEKIIKLYEIQKNFVFFGKTKKKYSYEIFNYIYYTDGVAAIFENKNLTFFNDEYRLDEGGIRKANAPDFGFLLPKYDVKNRLIMSIYTQKKTKQDRTKTIFKVGNNKKINIDTKYYKFLKKFYDDIKFIYVQDGKPIILINKDKVLGFLSIMKN